MNSPIYDQAIVSARDFIPRIWWGLYQGCLQTGFDKVQSFALLQTYILSQNPNGIRPNDCTGPKSDDE